MEKINIGDKVLVRDYVLDKHHIPTNETLRVTNVFVPKVPKTKLYEINGRFHVLETDIVNVNPTFTKNDIKANMLVKLANGGLHDVVMFEHGLELVTPTLPIYIGKYYINLDDFNQNMEFSKTSAEHHNIVAVYGYCNERYNTIAESYDLTNRPLLWSRVDFGTIDTPEYEQNVEPATPKVKPMVSTKEQLKDLLELITSEQDKQKSPVKKTEEPTIEC